MSPQVLLWVLFNLFIFGMLALDLGVFHRKAHEIKFKEALRGAAAWVGLALLFNVLVYFWKGREAALSFLTGYLIEESLSVDNLFVFLLIFNYFRVPAHDQHRVLFWGILGAVLMRALFVVGGITLIRQFHWMIYLFGAFLILTGVKLIAEKEREIRPDKNPVLKVFRRLMPVTERYEGSRFFIKKEKVLYATPLLVVLLIVETMDVVFAVDSIPAILSITLDTFIVYTSNIFAILGLRSLYFALAGLMKLFHRLNYGISIILIFVGVKMLIGDFYKIPVGIALGVVAGILALSIAASILWPDRNKPAA